MWYYDHKSSPTCPSMTVKEQHGRRSTEDVAQQRILCTLCCNFKRVSKSWANTAEPWDEAQCQQASGWLTESRVHCSQQLAQVLRLQIKPGRRQDLTFPHPANMEDTRQTPARTFPLQ